MLNLLQAPFVQPTAAELAAAPAAALDVLGVLTQDPAQSAVGAAVRTALDEAEKTGELSTGYAAVVRIAQDDPDAPTKVQNTAALEKLLGRELRISPTRFEKYQTCPFGYFLQYILRADRAKRPSCPQHQRHTDPLGAGKCPAPPGRRL